MITSRLSPPRRSDGLAGGSDRDDLLVVHRTAWCRTFDETKTMLRCQDADDAVADMEVHGEPDETGDLLVDAAKRFGL